MGRRWRSLGFCRGEGGSEGCKYVDTRFNGAGFWSEVVDGCLVRLNKVVFLTVVLVLQLTSSNPW